jgi:hypothetical protein
MVDAVRPPSRPTLSRRRVLQAGVATAAAVAVAGPLHALGSQVALGARPSRNPGYGPLVNKGDLWLPAEFDYEVISVQGRPMTDGQPTPGIFDGMAAFRGRGNTTILIRNHENRERAGEIKVATGAFEYDPETVGGNTKLVVHRQPDGVDPVSRRQRFRYEVVEDFAILGGTSTNCAGGTTPWDSWITCEEVVKRSSNGLKHGYNFEVDPHATGPVPAEPIVAAGRFAHEASAWSGDALYQTEDRSIGPDATLGSLGACFYRYVPGWRPRRAGDLAGSTGILEALALRDEDHANMDTGRAVGVPYPTRWVAVPEPDHDDETDNRRDRVAGLTPTRVQGQDNGAAFFDRPEGLWVGANGKVYFDCTTGGAANLGQVWEYDPAAEVITLIYESSDVARLENPDNVLVVPHTGDVFLCEDSDGEQYVRGVTLEGEIYDFARTTGNETEFCGATFDPKGHTLYLNQQGERGSLPNGTPETRAVTYAVYGPFEARRKGPGGAL